MNLAIGDTTAEQIKIEIGCAMPLMTEASMEIRGRDLSSGLPRNVTITSTQIEEAMKESIGKIVEIIKINPVGLKLTFTVFDILDKSKCFYHQLLFFQF